jgi:hypothetical protein
MRSVAPGLANHDVRLCIAWLGMCCLAGCHGRPAAPAADAVIAPQARAEWRGRLPCADCDAIDAQLVLERGSRDGYRLTENYRTGGTTTRFVEQGRWQRQDTLLRLRGEGGSLRVYALLPDGRLQPRGSHGATLTSADEDVLVPVSAEYTP